MRQMAVYRRVKTLKSFETSHRRDRLREVVVKDRFLLQDFNGKKFGVSER